MSPFSTPNTSYLPSEAAAAGSTFKMAPKNNAARGKKIALRIALSCYFASIATVAIQVTKMNNSKTEMCELPKPLGDDYRVQ
ncbi:hypothetical protein [Ruegeria lacuscaerulensis]|uniref:hypothetical protein n=1 Tax=Ruegeria lacuscaerulensis TaxID=55218 RepID=UPI001F481E7B|nr:hypothetical protein [Ruegeria lacuscaerulensis]